MAVEDECTRCGRDQETCSGGECGICLAYYEVCKHCEPTPSRCEACWEVREEEELLEVPTEWGCTAMVCTTCIGDNDGPECAECGSEMEDGGMISDDNYEWFVDYYCPVCEEEE